MSKIYILLLLISIAFSSCFSIKSDYPEIKYYTLNPGISVLTIPKQINKSISMRSFTLQSDLHPERISVKGVNSSINYLFRQRWGADIDKLLSDYIFESLSNENIFSKGVYKSSENIFSDYVLDCQIIDFSAYNDSKNDDFKIKIELNLQVKEYNNSSKDNSIASYRISKVIKRDDKKDDLIAKYLNETLNEIYKELINNMITDL